VVLGETNNDHLAHEKRPTPENLRTRDSETIHSVSTGILPVNSGAKTLFQQAVVVSNQSAIIKSTTGETCGLKVRLTPLLRTETGLPCPYQ